MKIRIINPRSTFLPLAFATLTLPLTGLCAGPLYPSVVKGDGALGYYRFNDSLTRTLINLNIGSLGVAGNASNDLATVFGGTVYSMPGAVVGDGDRAAFYDYTTRTEIPFTSALNTPNTQPFSVEAWMYPVSDQGAPGMGALCNRWTQGGNRQGWVMYQRGANTNSGALSSGPGLGWEFRMYNDLDGGTHLDVQSQVPFTLGKWQHVVVVYDPVGGDPLAATLTIYIDGAFANAVTNAEGVAGYGPCTGDHVSAPNGQPAMSLGGYNNANSGTAGFANPWIGGVDDFAWYPAKLSAAQIQTHYQNATNANRSQSYSSLILSHNPTAYLRLNEVAPGPDTSFNVGDLRSAGNATNTSAIKHPGRSALGGRPEDSSHSGHLRGVSASGHAFASIPYAAANNPDAGVPFTIEGWFKPTSDDVGNGPCPINNRLAGSTTDRTGWVIYQRNPNGSYTGSGESAVGWALRVYHGSTTGGNDVITGASSAISFPDSFGYIVGTWQHVVFTWQPQTDNGTTASGSEQWQGVLTAYTNGVAAATNEFATYAANVNPTADAREPADFAVGSYNRASNPQEEFEGDVDEVAFYNNYVLTPEQVLAHYQTGTNSHPATNYETLVLNAAGDYYLANVGTPVPERTTIPQTYLRFNEPAYFPAANSGSLGNLADGSIVLAQNNLAGPVTAGFEGSNTAVPLEGTKSWVSLNDPVGLNISGQITLEAWIKPDAAQPNDPARIFSHGPPTLSHYLGMGYDNSVTNSTEVFLRVEGPNGGPYAYVVGAATNQDTVGTSFSKVTVAAPGGDFGGANWIYLAGTYDGTNWKLYRNGVLAGTGPAGFGALPVNGGEWAIGSTGMGWADFFSGGIDEAAIYATALSPATIAAHYYVGQNGPVSLTITPAAANTVNVTWPAGTLQQSSTVNGTYTDVLVSGSPATSPYNAAAAGAKFYRVKL